MRLRWSFLVVLGPWAACSAPCDCPAPADDLAHPIALVAAPVPPDDDAANAALDELQRSLDRLRSLHRIGAGEASLRDSARAGYAARWPSPTATTAGDHLRQRLLDLMADEYMLRHLNKYDRRTWIGSAERTAVLAEFDRANPGNRRRDGNDMRHRLDELRANVFVLESMHRSRRR